jgi:hypothetical protein
MNDLGSLSLLPQNNSHSQTRASTIYDNLDHQLFELPSSNIHTPYSHTYIAVDYTNTRARIHVILRVPIVQMTFFVTHLFYTCSIDPLYIVLILFL